MRCLYCFYADVAQNREVESFGLMKLETLEQIISRTLEQASRAVTLAFQGGEPTLAGLDFFRSAVKFVKNYNVKKLSVHFAIQTNGYIIDHEWAQFFAENGFLVGLSLDGNKDTHDINRLDAEGSGTYKRVMHAAALMDSHRVQYNILTVVNAATAKNIGSIYGFYKRNNFQYQQYIPCLDPLGEQRGQHLYSLTPQRYESFLRTLFDLWYRDIVQGKFAYNRYFENLVGMLLGHLPESCGMMGHCTRQLVVEADGGVYPCDFYVLDSCRIGNLVTDSFEELERRRDELGFIEQSMVVEEQCKVCPWYSLCRGGCRRDRDNMDGSLGLNYYCEAYKGFFEYSYERLKKVAEMISKKET